jgi:large subunit ribosomal protein L22
MEAKAELRYTMISPRKVRIVADEIRKKTVDEALIFLTAMRNRKKAIVPVEKTLKSAVANFSVVNPNLNTEQVYIKEIAINPGPAQKRIRARAQGRAMRRLKRTSHIKIVLSD